MGEVVYGVDFRKHRDVPQVDPMVELAKAIMGLIDEVLPDTAPCEVNPDPLDDTAV